MKEQKKELTKEGRRGRGRDIEGEREAEKWTKVISQERWEG